MIMRWTSTTLAAIVLLGACGQPKPPGPSADASMSSTTTKAPPSPWQAQLGQVVTLDGVAENAKLGALLLIGGSRTLWIDKLDAWPPDVHGKRVSVTGKLIERADLPVFVHQDGEPEMAGIPVPPGTDVEKASRRLLLTEARWKVIEPAR
jgi:hypothetical protein